MGQNRHHRFCFPQRFPQDALCRPPGSFSTPGASEQVRTLGKRSPPSARRAHFLGLNATSGFLAGGVTHPGPPWLDEDRARARRRSRARACDASTTHRRANGTSDNADAGTYEARRLFRAPSASVRRSLRSSQDVHPSDRVTPNAVDVVANAVVELEHGKGPKVPVF